jgi:hypothetical protein
MLRIAPGRLNERIIQLNYSRFRSITSRKGSKSRAVRLKNKSALAAEMTDGGILKNRANRKD